MHESHLIKRIGAHVHDGLRRFDFLVHESYSVKKLTTHVRAESRDPAFLCTRVIQLRDLAPIFMVDQET